MRMLWLLPLAACGGDDPPEGPVAVPEDSEQKCANGSDDDLDEAIDCVDSDCATFCDGGSDADTDTDTDTVTVTEEPKVCDVITQDGCEPGQECKLFWDADGEPSVSCVEGGATAMGQACETASDCEGSLTCWETCRPACHLTTDCEEVPPGLYDSASCRTIREGWGYCTTPCDPFDPGSCGGGAQCMLLIDTDLPSTDCVVTVGDAVAGETCTAPLDCAPGTACDDAPAGGYTCETVCDSDDDCTGTCRLLEGDQLGTCR